MTSDNIAVVVVAIAMAIGLAGVFLPLLPGLWLIWAAAIAYGLTTEFGAAGWAAVAVITVLGGVGTAAGVLVPQRRAGSVGIPGWGQLVAASAAVVGMFLVPVVGAAIGFIIGVLGVQVLVTRSLLNAPAAAWSILRAMALASGLQFLAGISMVVTWVLWVLAA